MSSFDSIESGTPLPPVAAGDLRRVFHLIQETTHGGTQTGIGIAATLIAEQCGQGANVLAVFFRAALLQVLLREGLPDNWGVSDEPSELVFEAMATFPMDQGVQGFDREAFIAHLQAR